ncbi:MAG: GNAT family N-acetyltransferase [Christensenellales bacterium]
MSKIRIALPHDLFAVRQIWNVCFDDEKEFVDWFFTERYEPQNTLVYHAGKSIVSAMQVFPRDLIIRGKKLHCGFVVGVSTMPEFRGRGFATDLMLTSFGMMYESGVHIAYLYPEAYELYRKTGWEVCSDTQNYQIYSNQIRKDTRAEKFDVASQVKDLNDLNRVYETFITGRSCCFQRSEKDWSCKLQELAITPGGGLMLIHKRHQPVAYAFYTVDMGVMQVSELVYVDESAMYDLLCALSAHHGGKMQFYMPTDSELYTFLPDGRGCVNTEPYGMGRIINLKTAVEGTACCADATSVRVRIIDEQIEQNDDIFEFINQDGEIVVSRAHYADIQMNIQGFTSLYCGLTRARSLKGMGLLESSHESAQKLDQFFPKQQCYSIEKY